MNKDLYGKYHDVPENILNNLKKYSNEKTIAKILEDKKVSYSNLKKILHDMENGEKKNLGGDIFMNWVKTKLQIDRDNIKTSKKSKKGAGIKNAFLKPHKKTEVLIPSLRHKKASERHSSAVPRLRLENLAIDEIKLINELIKKII